MSNSCRTPIASRPPAPASARSSSTRPAGLPCPKRRVSPRHSRSPPAWRNPASPRPTARARPPPAAPARRVRPSAPGRSGAAARPPAPTPAVRAAPRRAREPRSARRPGPTAPPGPRPRRPRRPARRRPVRRRPSPPPVPGPAAPSPGRPCRSPSALPRSAAWPHSPRPLLGILGRKAAPGRMGRQVAPGAGPRRGSRRRTDHGNGEAEAFRAAYRLRAGKARLVRRSATGRARPAAHGGGEGADQRRSGFRRGPGPPSPARATRHRVARSASLDRGRAG